MEGQFGDTLIKSVLVIVSLQKEMTTSKRMTCHRYHGILLRQDRLTLQCFYEDHHGKEGLQTVLSEHISVPFVLYFLLSLFFILRGEEV